MQGSILRQLVSRALQTAIFMLNEEFVKKILNFTAQNKIIVHIVQESVEFIVEHRQFAIM